MGFKLNYVVLKLIYTPICLLTINSYESIIIWHFQELHAVKITWELQFLSLKSL